MQTVFTLRGFIFGFGIPSFAASGIDLALDVGHEDVAAGLHQADERHYRDVGSNE